MKKEIKNLSFLLLVGAFFASINLFAQKTDDMKAPLLETTLQEFSQTLTTLKKTLRLDKEKLSMAIRPSLILNKIKNLIEMGNKASSTFDLFEKEHILFIKRIEKKLKSILVKKKFLSKSRIFKIHQLIKETSLQLTEKINTHKKEYFLNRTMYTKYKTLLFDLEEELIDETFDINLVTYKGVRDVLHYNFICNPLNGLSVCFVSIATLYALLQINTYFEEYSLERQIQNDVYLKEKGYPKLGTKEDSPEERKKFIKKIEEKKSFKPLSPQFETLKISSVTQGHDGVANCGAHAMFHAECFLKELETNIGLKPTRAEFKDYWDKYLDWAKNLPTSGLSYEEIDINGDFISSDIMKYYFREVRKNKDRKRVHIFEYGKAIEKNKETNTSELALLEKSKTCPSSKDMLEDLLDDDSKRSEDIRPFISEWADLLSGASSEPIICILSNGRHWIVAKYELDLNKKIKITIRDSLGISIDIAQKPALIIESLGREEIQRYKNIIDNPTEKIIVPDNFQVFSEYLLWLKDASNEEKLADKFMKRLIELIKEKKEKKSTLVFKTKVTTTSGISFAENEFKRTQLQVILKPKDDDTVSVDVKLDFHAESPTPETEEHVKQEGLPLHEWIEKRLLQPLFEFALKETSKPT